MCLNMVATSSWYMQWYTGAKPYYVNWRNGQPNRRTSGLAYLFENDGKWFFMDKAPNLCSVVCEFKKGML